MRWDIDPAVAADCAIIIKKLNNQCVAFAASDAPLDKKQGPPEELGGGAAAPSHSDRLSGKESAQEGKALSIVTEALTLDLTMPVLTSPNIWTAVVRPRTSSKKVCGTVRSKKERRERARCCFFA
jgi:hypothetical protein